MSRWVREAAYVTSILAGLLILIFGYREFGLGLRFHIYMGFATLSFLAAPAVIFHLDNKRKIAIDNSLPILLDDLTEGQEAGMTLIEALEAISKRRYGPITRELRKLVIDISWGMRFEDAFAAFSKRIKTDLTEKITALLLESMRVGGDLRETFRLTARFAREIVRLREERASQLRPFLITAYASYIIFLVITIILYHSFFLPVAAQAASFLILPMPLEEYKKLLLDLLIIEAVACGLIAGKLSRGTITDGFKHAFILNLVAILVFIILM